MSKPKPKRAASTGPLAFMTAEDRARIPARKAPYWIKLGRNQSLGFTKTTSGSTWTARLAKPRKQALIGVPDDHPPLDDLPALTLEAAIAAAKAWCAKVLAPPEPEPVAGIFSSLTSVVRPTHPTVGHAMDYHLSALELRQVESIGTARSRHNRIKRALGNVLLEDLTGIHITNWLANIVNTPPQRRSKSDGTPNFDAAFEVNDFEAKRQRQSTANRYLADLLASLNMAYANRWVTSDQAWCGVKPFKNCKGIRDTILTAEQQSAWLNACTPELRPLCYGALLTGNRFGPLSRWQVKDFRPIDQCIRAGWDMVAIESGSY